ncbi:MAG: hypothetical protein QXP27_06670, partial [Candidatus Methanomethyliaceae archaeon]
DFIKRSGGKGGRAQGGRGGAVDGAVPDVRNCGERGRGEEKGGSNDLVPRSLSVQHRHRRFVINASSIHRNASSVHRQHFAAPCLFPPHLSPHSSPLPQDWG